MKQAALLLLISTFLSCKIDTKTRIMSKANTATGCADGCNAKSKDSTTMACKLTSTELRERKETVLASLKSKVIEKKETTGGYAFKFAGSDEVIDELTEFIKTERECCDFFTFNLSIAGDKNETWLEMTGADGAKEFITTELGL